MFLYVGICLNQIVKNTRRDTFFIDFSRFFTALKSYKKKSTGDETLVLEHNFH